MCCRDLVAAAALMAAARTVFKNVGLQGWGDAKEAKLIVAIWGDEGLDMPLTGPTGIPLFQGQDAWLQSLVNSRHLRNWGKIDRFTAALRQLQERVNCWKLHYRKTVPFCPLVCVLGSITHRKALPSVCSFNHHFLLPCTIILLSCILSLSKHEPY